ncbi:MAG TPA: folylpolyglutamate synthase/dihydrofolate synthase family protein, partial [Bacteroidales bacterium]|nr:folylpolyglutamate synthase/dihydrofolate synthase family protein [Bacteroidales bacterium]
MNYRETLEFLYNSLPMFQRTGAAAYKANLDNTHALDDYFGHPHRKFRCIHIAGTNGKGSVSHTLAAVLQSSGYRTGLYTSPHLKDFRERIRINGELIPEEDVVSFIEDAKNIIEKIQPSFFEITVMMAFSFFARQDADIAVIETGMGGRLDSTNIIDPLLSIITNIGPDHTRFLGDTLDKIATEKAGIIKPGRPVIISEWLPETGPVFEKKAAENLSALTRADRRYHIDYSTLTPERYQTFHVHSGGKTVYQGLVSDLTGMYQRKNIPAVLSAIDILREMGMNITDDAIYKGVANVRKMTGLRGRWEETGYNPLMVCDAAHNAPGIKEVVRQIMATPHRRLHMVWGMVSDKDVEGILKLLPTEAQYYFTKADIPRAMDENDLHKKATAAGLHGRAYP